MTTTFPPAGASAPAAHRLPSSALDPVRLARAKRSFTTRNVARLHTADAAGWSLLADDEIVPRAGDLVLARVTELGQHTRLERPDGRRATLHQGDEIVIAYGARYAPDQFEGVVPDDLGPCDLLAAGGVAGTCIARSEAVGKPTRIEPLGVLACDARRASLRDWTPLAPPAQRQPAVPHPAVIGVAGTAMNAGKTTALAGLVRGLTDAGVRVGAAKVTGTGAGGDVWLYRDAGAEWVRDFTDAGHASTYQVDIGELERVAAALVDDIATAGADVVLVEIADGVLQAEAAALLASPVLHGLLDGLVFAAGDALSAAAGAKRLAALGYEVLAVTGRFTASPLALREARQELSLGGPVAGYSELRDPAVATAVARRHSSSQDTA